MKSMLLTGAAALALSTGAFAQAATDMPAKNTTSSTTSAGADGQFITKQDAGQVRAPKLVGVAVYDKDNKSVGKIDDLLLDKQGKVQAVVIGIGGFLGIGRKDVALPYDSVKWQTEERTVATNGAAPAAGNAMNNTNGAVTGTTTANNANTTQPGQKTVTPAQQEAYNGYPDRAMVDMSQQQLKDAPEFKYASETANSAADVKKQP